MKCATMPRIICKRQFTTVQVMINLSDIRYVRLGTGDMQAADRFAREIVGLELVRTEGASNYYRSDTRDHTLVYTQGTPDEQSVGFELKSREELDAAFELLQSRGIAAKFGTEEDCGERRAAGLLMFQDPTGNNIELVLQPHDSAKPFAPSRDAGITGFSHIGLCSKDPVRDEAFWTGALGARVSDRIGKAPLLRIDEVHHKIALFPTNRTGIQHVNHQVASIDDVMRAWYLLKRKGVKIVFGPGRHPTSSAMFLYFEGPDGMVYEFSTGVRNIPAEQETTHVPRQFPAANESFCMWGAVPDIAEFKTAP
jgi:2,3-dihydroxy-p-cumate/2,3-dihydroxybenzoate 3,4-dioxygenase